jgi:hypothetical protein
MLRILPAPKSNLKDIRPDLKERLRTAVSERDQMRPILETLEQTITLLEQMIEQENRRYHVAPTSPESSLADFIVQKMQAGLRTKDGLRSVAEEAGYNVDGRSIHLTLVNLIKSGRAVEIGGGEFAASG